MARLTYHEQFDIYRTDADENSPEDWVLVDTDVAMSVKPLGAWQRQQESIAIGAADRRFSVTHRGRCKYNSNIEGRPDSRLLVSQETGDQYLVLSARQSWRYRGGNGNLVMALSAREPPTYRLKRT